MMAATPAPPASTSDLSRLSWQSQCGTQVANDGRCLYMREGMGSIIAGAVVSVVICVAAGWAGVWLLFIESPVTGMGKAFGVFLLIVAAVFAYVPWPTIRNGRWLIVYDRGEPGVPGEIRYKGKRLSAERVRGFSTRSCGGRPPRSIVVAELQDGTHEALGPVGISTWPAHFSQQAATWMGLPFRYSAD